MGLSKRREGEKNRKVGNWAGFKVRVSISDTLTLTLTLALTLTLTLTITVGLTLIPALTLLAKREGGKHRKRKIGPIV